MAPKKETVIIIHGTFSSPQENGCRWYEPGQSFCRKLDGIFAASGSNARCWAHMRPGDSIFSWSGENNWQSRTEGAHRLASLIRRLQMEGWVCHLVAHSHGGNVLMEALYFINEPSNFAGAVGKAVTMGTPFILHDEIRKYDVSEQFFIKRKFLLVLASQKDEAVRGLKILHRSKNPFSGIELKSSLDKDKNLAGSIWQFMKFRNFAYRNPFGRFQAFILFFFISVTLWYCWQYGIYFWTLIWFFLTLLIGFLIARPIEFFRSVVDLGLGVWSIVQRSFLQYLMRRRLWETIRGLALGTSGAPFRRVKVSDAPSLARKLYKYKPYEPPDIDIDFSGVQQKKVGQGASMLMAIIQSADEIPWKTLLNSIRILIEDLPMLHTNYYESDHCIDLIAKWIHPH